MWEEIQVNQPWSSSPERYKHACQAYTNALNAAKTTYYKEKISGASNDQLFKMINGLFRVKAVPPLPSHESLPALADTFSCFYHSKIVKLREKLEQSEFSAMDLSPVKRRFWNLYKYQKRSSQSWLWRLPISYPESTGFLVSGRSPVETLG